MHSMNALLIIYTKWIGLFFFLILFEMNSVAIYSVRFEFQFHAYGHKKVKEKNTHRLIATLQMCDASVIDKKENNLVKCTRHCVQT